MEWIGIRRPRGRDLATGIVLGAALGLAALFLYLDTTGSSTTGATVNVLFGSIFTLPSSMVPVIAIFSVVAAGIVLAMYRPLILSSISSDLATAQGVRVRLVGIGYLVALALAVSLSAVTIGAILSTALLIGPAATALRITNRTGRAAVIAAGIGVIATWLGVLLAYDSYYWFPSGGGWPVSFFVVTLIFLGVSRFAASVSRTLRCSTPLDRRAGQADVLGPDAQRLGVGVDRRHRRGRRRILHRPARVRVCGARAAQRSVRRRGRGEPHRRRRDRRARGVLVLGALTIAGLGRRARHDVATALVIVVMLGLGSLFLSMTTEYAPEIFSLLFGEVLGVSSSELIPIAVIGVICIAAMFLVYRPLMLSSVMPDVAEARGVGSGRMEVIFLLVVALTTTMAVPVVGALLIFSLLISPAAAARSFTNKPFDGHGPVGADRARARCGRPSRWRICPTFRSGSSSAPSVR